MDNETLTALRASIKHWEEMRDAPDFKDRKNWPSAGNCALCQLFLEDGCKGCPIPEKTGKTACFKTPYYAAFEIFDLIKIEEKSLAEKTAFNAEAQKMIDFMEGLLP